MTWHRTVRKNEQVNTYMVQDLRYKKAELLRLDLQDALITTAMGGVLSEQADLRAFRRILDVGCGLGGWLLQAAQMYPERQSINKPKWRWGNLISVQHGLM